MHSCKFQAHNNYLFLLAIIFGEVPMPMCCKVPPNTQHIQLVSLNKYKYIFWNCINLYDKQNSRIINVKYIVNSFT